MHRWVHRFILTGCGTNEGVTNAQTRTHIEQVQSGYHHKISLIRYKGLKHLDSTRNKRHKAPKSSTKQLMQVMG